MADIVRGLNPFMRSGCASLCSTAALGRSVWCDARLVHRLQHLARHDGLTGPTHRRSLLGALSGDAVLRRVSQTLRSSSREVGAMARMGGEEFCVLAPMTGSHGAVLLAMLLAR